MATAKPNWKKIKGEYIRGGISQQKLADKYGVSISTIERRARLEKWTELRKAREGKAAEKLVEKTAEKEASIQAEMASLLMQAGLQYFKYLLGNITAYPEGAGTRIVREAVQSQKVGEGEKAVDIPLKSVIVNDVEASVKALAGLAKLFGLDAASGIAREKLSMERQDGNGTDGFNANLVSIAELINHPMPDRSIADIEADGDQDD